MASLLEIITEDGISLDMKVGADEDFYVTFLIHDLNSLETRNSSYSKTINIPSSEKNLKALNLIKADFTRPTKKILCSITMEGVQVAPKAELLVTGVTDTNGTLEREIQVSILFDNFDFFDLKGQVFLDRLNWADLAVNWETADVVNIINADKLVFAIADWNTRNSLKVLNARISDIKRIDLNECGFFIYVEEILRRICNEVGYNLVLANNLPANFSKLALACPVTDFADSPTSGDGTITSIRVQKVANTQVVIGATERLIFDVRVLDPSSEWNLTLNQWENIPTGNYNFEITGVYSYDRVFFSPGSAIVLYRNTTEVGRFTLGPTQVGTNIPFFFATEVAIVSGDIVYAEVEAFGGFGPFNDEVRINRESTFFDVLSAGSTFDRVVQPSKYIPEMKASEFIKGIVNLYNLVIETNPVSRTVTISNFNDVFDFSNPLNIDSFIDISREVTAKNSIESIGRVSEFKWIDDNLLRRDINAEVFYESESISPEKVSIQLPFSACDNSKQLFDPTFDTFLKAKIPSIEVEEEYPNGIFLRFASTDIDNGVFFVQDEAGNDKTLNIELGDFIQYRTNNPGSVPYQSRVVSLTPGNSGVVETPRVLTSGGPFIVDKISKLSSQDVEPRLAIIIQDGGESFYEISQGTNADNVNLNGGTTAVWLDELRWTSLVDNEYKKLLEAFNTPLVVNVWASITSTDVIGFDFKRPVYSQLLNGYFYVNKIEQYKVNSLCRLELVRLNDFKE